MITDYPSLPVSFHISKRSGGIEKHNFKQWSSRRRDDAMEKKDLQKLSVSKLREEALKYKDQIAGTIQAMKKEELVKALMDVLGIKETEEEKPAVEKKKKAKAVRSKETLKKEMMALKKEKDDILKSKDKAKIKILRRKLKTLNRKVRHLAAATRPASAS